MAYPNGVALAVLTLGAVGDFFGGDAVVSAKVTPVLGGTSHLVHKATGDVLVPTSMDFVSEPGGVLSVSVPIVDQPGWVDASGREFAGWSYRVVVTVQMVKSRAVSWETHVSPVTGQTLVDLDMVPVSGESGTPTVGEVPKIVSVVGKTGAVTVQDLRAAGVGTWEGLTGKPATFAPATHNHTTAQIDGLAAALAAAGKVQSVLGKTGAITAQDFIDAGLNGSGGSLELQAAKDYADQVTADLAPTVTPRLEFTHIGDSLTQWPDASNYSSQLPALTGREHNMEGWANQTSADIAARMGGIRTWVNVLNDSIPGVKNAYAQSTVMSIGNPVGGIQRDQKVYGSIAGRAGYLLKDSAGVTRFHVPEASPTGVATVVPRPVEFVPDVSETYKKIVTVWSGANDVWSSSPPPEVIASLIKSIVDRCTAQAPQVMVLTIPNRSTYPEGNAVATKVAEINKMFAAAFPAQLVDIAGHLMSEQAAADAGVTYTDDDRADIANKVTPRVFRTDSIHLNAAGAKAVATEIYRQAKTRGWI